MSTVRVKEGSSDVMRARLFIQFIRSLLQRNFKILGMNPVYYVAAVGLGIGIAGGLVAFISDSENLRGLSLFTSGLGLIALILQSVKDAAEISSQRRNLYATADRDWSPEAELSLTERYREAGYTKVTPSGQMAVRSDLVDSRLCERDIRVRIDHSKFVLVDEARHIGPMVLTGSFKGRRVLYNNSKARLATDLLLDTDMVTLQRTDYFASLCTNEVTGRIVRSRRQIASVYDGWAMVVEDGRLFDLSVSPCSNHIGISTLAITRDSHLILTLQPSRAAQNAGLLAPSGSGSMDYFEAQHSESLQRLLANAMERELREECGLGADVADPIVQTQVLGFARLVRRGGKPEFFGVSLLDMRADEIEDETQEVGLLSSHITISLGDTSLNSHVSADFESLLQELKSRHDLSPQLELAMMCLGRNRAKLPRF